MKKIRYLIAAIALLLFVPACGTGSPTCEKDTDCTSTEKCLWMTRNGQVVGQRCVTKCTADNECGSSGHCTGTAKSCPGCNDNYRVCEQ